MSSRTASPKSSHCLEHDHTPEKRWWSSRGIHVEFRRSSREGEVWGVWSWNGTWSFKNAWKMLVPANPAKYREYYINHHEITIKYYYISFWNFNDLKLTTETSGGKPNDSPCWDRLFVALRKGSAEFPTRGQVCGTDGTTDQRSASIWWWFSWSWKLVHDL